MANESQREIYLEEGITKRIKYCPSILTWLFRPDAHCCCQDYCCH